MFSNLIEQVNALGSSTLQNIIANLRDTSAVREGRTVIDFKLFDVRTIAVGVSGGTGSITLASNYSFFDKTTALKTLSATNFVATGEGSRVSNIFVDGKADEPYRFDRVALYINVFDTASGHGNVTADVLSAIHSILNSGKLTLTVNGRELSFADPIGYCGSSSTYKAQVGGASSAITYFDIKKNPKMIDPAIFLPETTTFRANIDFSNPVQIPNSVSVQLGVELLGIKFLKNA